MANRRTPIVCQHLERTSSDILENYRKIIEKYIKGKQGVYALYKKNELYYVGMATNLMGRLDRHQQKWGLMDGNSGKLKRVQNGCY